MTLRDRARRLWFSLLGKDPRPVVAVLRCGNPERAERIEREMRQLLPSTEIAVVEDSGAQAGVQWLQLHRRFESRRVALVAAPLDGGPLFRAALAFAPRRILAFNHALERFHLRASQPVSSFLFWKGVPLDRIHLRPSWWVPWKKDRSTLPREWRHRGGRGFRPARPRVAIVSPYLPWPASHGGAVRIWNLLRECADEFDILFFGFEDGQTEDDYARIARLCAGVWSAAKPRYREPLWSTLAPPEVLEFHNPVLHRALQSELVRHGASILQAEYTQLAAYRPDILVEHDITQDLMLQVLCRRRSLIAWWNWRRWKWFEDRALRRARRVIVMSDKDRELARLPAAATVPNGVDLRRFSPTPEEPGERLLFIGSFRHFPNVRAWRFLLEEVWPLVRNRRPSLHLEAVAGPDPHLYWQGHADSARITLHGFVADVVPLYRRATLVAVPTLVSAGTNLKALEAMAMERAIVSTPSGVAGLGLVHGESAWIAEDAGAFAEGVLLLLENPARRRALAAAARRLAVAEYAWPALAERQASVWREMLPPGQAAEVRPMRPEDLPAVAAIQAAQPLASQWRVGDYLDGLAWVALRSGRIEGFLAARRPAPDELEILNLAVRPDSLRHGFAARLLKHALLGPERSAFLEVRESNQAARTLYERHGFQTAGRRRGYYRTPEEDGIVMNLQKW